MSVSKEDIEKFKEIGRRLEEEKKTEKKKTPQMIALEERQVRLRKDADAAAKQLAFLSTTDIEEVQNCELKDNIIKMLKELEDLDSFADKLTKKLDEAWMPPSLADQKRSASEMNDIASRLFGQFCILGNQQNWAKSEYGENYFPKASKQLEVKAVARSKRLRDDGCPCNCAVLDHYGGQCSSRCPCKKAGKPCVDDCRCSATACTNQAKQPPSRFFVPSKIFRIFLFLIVFFSLEPRSRGDDDDDFDDFDNFNDQHTMKMSR